MHLKLQEYDIQQINRQKEQLEYDLLELRNKNLLLEKKLRESEAALNHSK